MSVLQKIRDVFNVPTEVSPYIEAPSLYEKSSLFMPISNTLLSVLNEQEMTYEKLAVEGFQKNPYIFSCIDTLANAGANLKLSLFKGRREIVREHKILDLLNNVYYGQSKLSYYDFMYYMWAYFYLAGNAYLWVDVSSGEPSQVVLLSPKEIRIEVIDNKVSYYINNKLFRGNGARLIHLKFFHPFQKVEGMSPLNACALSIDQNNAGRIWNTNLLNRMTKTDGYLESNAGRLSEKQRLVLKNEMEAKTGGANNVMKTMVLPGGMKFHPLTLSAVDMDWEKVMSMSGREISMALKVPAELLGFENRTYGNVKEAKAGLYSEAVIPQMNRILSFLNNELLSLFNSGQFRLEIDMDKVDVLKRDRNLVTKQAVSLFDSGIITKNEARKLLGYDERPGEDVFKEDIKPPDFTNVAREAELEKEPNNKEIAADEKKIVSI